MSESDIDNTEATSRPACDNDCFSPSFLSLMDERFKSHVDAERVEYGSDEQRERTKSYRDNP